MSVRLDALEALALGMLNQANDARDRGDSDRFHAAVRLALEFAADARLERTVSVIEATTVEVATLTRAGEGL